MKKLHKITGIILAFVLIWMCFSGVVLNHRKAFAGSEIPRNYLPESYRYADWNYGFFKGSLALNADTVFLFGNEGVWLTDTDGTRPEEFNNGLRPGADNLKVCRMVTTPGRDIYCATLYHLYRLHAPSHRWTEVQLPRGIDRIADMEVKGDTLLVLTRSELLVKTTATDVLSTPFERIELQPSPDRTAKRSLFRLIWKLHSGELFGTAGKIVVDFLALAIAFFCITGLLIWLLPKSIKARKRRRKSAKKQVSTLKYSWKWHGKLGLWFTLPLLVLVITGAFLRPPLLIAIARAEVTPPPLTTMRSENSWEDQLRVIRYDRANAEWLLYTSDGFFTLPELNMPPRKTASQPPVSVMGVHVLQQIDDECWVTGSFSGLIIWNRTTGTCIDGFTGEPARALTGMPFGQRKISGFSTDFARRTIVFDYDRGVHIFEPGQTFAAMPAECAVRPMSLWNLALEMHTGRVLTFLGMGNVLFVFVVGITSALMIFSGWRVYVRRRKRVIS